MRIMTDKNASKLFCRSLVIVLVLFCLSCWLQPVAVEARAGGGSLYQPGENQPSSPELPVESVVGQSEAGPASGKNNADPGMGEDAVKKQEARETADWYRQNVKVSEKDYQEYYWFGVLLVLFLLLITAGMTIGLTLAADRKDGSFVKGRLIPLGCINFFIWLFLWRVCEAFSLPLWPVFASILLTIAIHIWDAFNARCKADSN